MTSSYQTAIPCLLMRGGSSKGSFFNAADLPQDVATRDRVLLAALGSPDARKIEDIGSAHPLTSKMGIVSASAATGVDQDLLFAQLQPDTDTVDATPNCGNMLAAVVPFALETGMVQPRGESTTLRVLTRNTGMQCDITVDTCGGVVQYEGRARIDGAPGTSAIRTTIFLNTAGSVCAGVAVVPVQELDDTVSVEHPTGEFSVALDPATPHNVTRADLLRTARMLLRGEVRVPALVLDGVRK